MRKMMRAFRERFSKYSMRTKLVLSFSVTIVAVFVLVMVIINYFIGGSYRERLLHSATQSYDQAFSYLETNIDNMLYVSDLIYYNGDLQRILTADSFTGDRNDAEQYREFLTLDNVFSTIERNESIYLARIFIPDEIKYSNNFRHFYSLSQLEARGDYEAFAQKSRSEMVYFTRPEDVEVPGIFHTVNMLSLLRTIKSTDGSAKTIAVEQVYMETARIQGVIDKSNITSHGLVYLVNGRGEIVSSSETGQELLQNLREEQAFPANARYGDWKTENVLAERYLVNQRQLVNADWTLVALIPESEIDAQGRQILLIILTLTLFAVIVIFMISFLLAKYYVKRLNRLTAMMEQVKTGETDIDFEESSGDEIGQLFQSFEYMTGELKNLMEQQYRSGKAIKSAQLRALQAQINPHFLYNTLDLINWEAIDHNAPEIAEIAQNLARFYRISLNKGHQIVSIKEEIEHVRAYVQIENRHFDDAIHLSVDIPEEILELACINIILQPFVENSIMHGIAKDTGIQECSIHIKGELQDGDILLRVSDDGLGMEEKQLEDILQHRSTGTHGYGIRNIHSRIKLCYGEDYGLSFQSEKGKGTLVLIRIPAKTLEQARFDIED